MVSLQNFLTIIDMFGVEDLYHLWDELDILLDKYLLEATTRADGASVFAENNKWAISAVSVAYKVEEDISLILLTSSSYA